MKTWFRNKWDFVLGTVDDFRYGVWDCGVGWWQGSSKVFDISKTYYDGNHYGIRIGPFWACCSPF